MDMRSECLGTYCSGTVTRIPGENIIVPVSQKNALGGRLMAKKKKKQKTFIVQN